MSILYKSVLTFSAASLQDLCLREVINNLECYPPELLACLPPTLRHPLLVHMPIVDLCQLENTCVFDGVDAEMVWKERYEQQTLKYTSLIANEYSSWNCGLSRSHLCIVNDPERLLDRYKTMREKYFAAIVYSIFECARPTGYYFYYSELPDEATTLGNVDLRKLGLLENPVDLVNYLVASVKIDVVVTTREQTEETYGNPDNIYFDYHIPEYELIDSTMCGEPLNHHTYMNASELYQEVPPRYSSFLNEENHCRLSEEDALMLLMDKCDYYAGDMHINVVRCSAIRWNWEDEKIKSLVGRFFSKMFKLDLCCYSKVRVIETLDPSKFIMEAIFSSSSQQLFVFTVLEACDDHVHAIVPLLSNPNTPRRIEKLYFDQNMVDFDTSNAIQEILSSGIIKPFTKKLKSK